MDTRNTLNLNNQSLSELQLPPPQRKQLKSSDTKSSIKDESPSISKSSASITSTNSNPVSQSYPIMTETDDLLEFEQIHDKRIQLENKFLAKIPIFKSPIESNVDEFLSQADSVFNVLKYTDNIRLLKIGEKLDETLQLWFTNFQRNDNPTWDHFQKALPHCLHSSSLFTNISVDHKAHAIDEHHPRELVDKPLLLNLLHDSLFPFDGTGNARQWFIQMDSKFSELKMSFHDRLEILPYFFVGDVILWYSLNKHKMQCYTDFCRLFALAFFQTTQAYVHDVPLEYINRHSSLHSPVVVTENVGKHSSHCLSEKPSTPLCPLLSPTISKALIDRFVKDPIKFLGGKDNVINWLDEIEQQFKIMNLNELDKLNLIHICLKGEAYQWYKQKQEHISSWSIFVDEITKSFTSHLQRDSAFKKLQQFHQTVHQSVTQYFTEMIKLMKQADPQMNESTKVQYLMNGLRPSLSIETRRNYPNTSQEFLEQAKVAEELTALNSIITTTSINNDDITPSTSLSYSTNNSTSTNTFQNYPRAYDPNHYNYDTNYSPHDSDPQRSLNRIYKQSSSLSYDRNRSSPLSCQPTNQ